MSQYDNTNKASLWKNDRKTEDKHPDYKGQVNVEGVEYWMSGWINTAGPNSKRAGEKYISLRLEMKEGQQAGQASQRQQRAAPPPQQQDSFDDIPF